jgi:hypothetical protein
MKRNVSIALLLSVLLVLLGAGLFYFLPGRAKTTRITIVGESQAKIAPDTAAITFSVVTQDKVAVTAQQNNAKKTEAVIKALEAVTSEQKPEIKTEGYSLDPEEKYTYNSLPSIIGYSAKNTVTILTKDLNNTGAYIDAATKAGANAVDGIAFVIKEDSPAQGEALGIATRQAMAKAEAIANSLGGKVIRVVEMREGGAPEIPDYSNYGYAANAAANAVAKDYRTPIRSGSKNVYALVTLVVEVQAKT